MSREDTIRKIAIQALFLDDELLDRLTLKGGNALRLIHGIGTRASIDLDFSLEGDFEDLKAIQERMFFRLKEHLAAGGFVGFDFAFGRKPKNSQPGDRWGGYQLTFKAITQERYQELGGDLEHLRRQAATVSDASQRRVFKVEISPFEYSKRRQEAELGDYSIYVYTLEMIVLEKLRAICQQMEEYPHRGHPTARARDFYDIDQIFRATQMELASPDNLETCRAIFAAKEVPLELLAKIHTQREFHRVDWPAVVGTVQEPLESFDVYFDAVVEAVDRLEPLWVK
jgi:predicted nucleotidyltransferase component of viral defense system